MSDESTQPDERLAALKRAILGTPGALASEERERICEAARRASLEPITELGLDPPLDALVRAVAAHPAQADVAGLLAAGSSEDEVFEMVIAAALGAALVRAEAGLTALGHRR